MGQMERYGTYFAIIVSLLTAANRLDANEKPRNFQRGLIYSVVLTLQEKWHIKDIIVGNLLCKFNPD